MGTGNKRRRRILQNFWQKLTFNYRVSVVNEDEQKDVRTRRVSLLSVIFAVLAIVLASGAITLMLYSYSSAHRDAMVEQNDVRRQIVDDALRLDSLEQVLEHQDLYLQSMQSVLLGFVSMDSVPSLDSLVLADSRQSMEASDLEKEFSLQYEENERYNITSQTPAVSDVRSLNLFRPTTGLVTEGFNTQKRHYGVDVAANPNESVISVMDGVVVMSSYTAENGFVLCIHHTGDLLSVYKYCGSVLKKEGDKVKAGDVIALVGKASAPSAKGSHLHFELWYEGQALDPEKYIVF